MGCRGRRAGEDTVPRIDRRTGARSEATDTTDGVAVGSQEIEALERLGWRARDAGTRPGATAGTHRGQNQVHRSGTAEILEGTVRRRDGADGVGGPFVVLVGIDAAGAGGGIGLGRDTPPAKVEKGRRHRARRPLDIYDNFRGGHGHVERHPLDRVTDSVSLNANALVETLGERSVHHV